MRFHLPGSAKMGRKFGFSWSWRRASGLSGAKSKLSRRIGIPLTAGGRQQKLGRMVERSGLGLILLLMAAVSKGRQSSSSSGGGAAPIATGCGCIGCAGVLGFLLLVGICGGLGAPRMSNSTASRSSVPAYVAPPAIGPASRSPEPTPELEPEPKPSAVEPVVETAPASTTIATPSSSPHVVEPQLPRISDRDKKVVSSFEAKVVGVTDGDTITVLTSDNEQRKIRLDAIDAPEHKQPYSDKSSAALSTLVFGKVVRIDDMGRDSYGRTLGRVWVDKDSINRRMIADGWAWHYKEYSDSTVLAAAEGQARESKLGLWAGKDPVPPWEWRHPDRSVATEPRSLLSSSITESSAQSRAPPASAGTSKGSTARGPVNALISSDSAGEESTGHSHWLTTSSGVRHNSSCQYYKNSKGRACGPGDGRACKRCGG